MWEFKEILEDVVNDANRRIIRVLFINSSNQISKFFEFSNNLSEEDFNIQLKTACDTYLNKINTVEIPIEPTIEE